MGMLASQAEIGVWVLARKILR